MSQELAHQLQLVLGSVRYVARAHLVRKVTRHAAGSLYVLVLVPKGGLVSTSAHAEAKHELANGIHRFMETLLSEGDRAHLAWTVHATGKLGKAAARVPGSVVFDRKQLRRAA